MFDNCLVSTDMLLKVSHRQWLSDILIPVIYPISARVEVDFHIDQSRLSWWFALINLNLSQGIYNLLPRCKVSQLCVTTGAVSKCTCMLIDPSPKWRPKIQIR